MNRLVRVTWLVAACWIAGAAISTSAGEPIRVPAGGDLQAAINQARSGDRVLLAALGLDVQLHTHRHRTPRERELFDDEIARNRQRITEMTGQIPTHFCYPSGVYDRRFLPWLSDLSVTSATTCDSGFAMPDTHALLLPRLVDHEGLAPIEFEGWLTGAAALTARKRDLKDVIA